MQNKIFWVAHREYMQRFNSTWFWILSILIPILLFTLLFLSIFLGQKNHPTYKVLIYAETETLNFVKKLKLKNNDKLDIEFFYSDIFIPVEDLVESPYNIEIYLDPELLINLQNTPESTAIVPLIFTEPLTSFAESYIRSEIETKFERMKLQFFNKNKGFSKEAIQEFDQLKVRLRFNPLPAYQGLDETWKLEKRSVALLVSILILCFIFLYSPQIMRSILDEKINKILEIILSTLSPLTWLSGKIIGLMLLAFTQFLTFVFVFLILFLGFYFLFKTYNFETDTVEMLVYLFKEQINYPLIISIFLICSVLGYFLYAGWFALFVLRLPAQTDLSSWFWSLLSPLCFSSILLYLTLEYPQGIISKYFVFFPFTTPILLPIRIIHGLSTWTELILSLLFLIFSVIFLLFLTKKRYGKGIL